MLNWNHNLAIRLDNERGDLKLQSNSLKVVIRSHNLNMDHRFRNILQHQKQLDALKTLEKLHHLQAVSPSTSRNWSMIV
ncbi:hypothetical protein MJD09_12050 [bacterium]|nr:hypothetical protein [bacterium]